MVSAVTQYVCVRARAYSISTANQARPRNSVHRLTFAHQISVLLGAKGFKVNATGSLTKCGENGFGHMYYVLQSASRLRIILERCFVPSVT